jgi:hypothetical protein
MSQSTRREFLQSSGLASIAMASKLAASNRAVAGSAQASFDINQAFASFTKEIGGAPEDAGGNVVFTGRGPIVRSHFRIGACMAIPAMAAALEAAAIWRERTGQSQDLEVDLRESVYNVLPYVGFVLQKKQQAGLIDPDDPLPAGFTWRPKVKIANSSCPFCSAIRSRLRFSRRRMDGWSPRLASTRGISSASSTSSARRRTGRRSPKR